MSLLKEAQAYYYQEKSLHVALNRVFIESPRPLRTAMKTFHAVLPFIHPLSYLEKRMQNSPEELINEAETIINFQRPS